MRPVMRDFNDGTREILGACIEVHRHLGPGLLESVYELCLAHELRCRGIRFERQLSVPIRYKDVALDAGLRLDFLVECRVVVEVKAIDRIAPVHEAQLLTYLRLTGAQVGLLVNFNVPALRLGGIRRMSRREPTL